MAGMVRVYVEGPGGAHVFDAGAESSTYNSSIYGQVKPAVLVFLDGELHVYGAIEEKTAVGGYVVSFNGGVLRIGGSDDRLIRAYAPGAWQQVYEHPLLHSDN